MKPWMRVVLFVALCGLTLWQYRNLEPTPSEAGADPPATLPAETATPPVSKRVPPAPSLRAEPVPEETDARPEASQADAKPVAEKPSAQADRPSPVPSNVRPPEPKPAATPRAKPSLAEAPRPPPAVPAERASLGPKQRTVPNVSVKNYDRVVYRGTVDLGPTIDRILRGERHSHRNDGSVFRNREKRLPRKKRGYYREFVHPTPGIRGPGPQRLVVGEGGEWYYTADHYGSFVRLR